MMPTILAWILVPCVLAAACPWSAWLLRHSPRDDGRWLAISLALALSVGTLTLVMFWLSLLGVLFSVEVVTLVYAALMLPGIILWQGKFVSPHPLSPSLSWRRGKKVPLPEREGFRVRAILWLVILAIAGAVLFNAAYWPFSRDDTRGIYHPQAQQMAETRALLPLKGADSLYLAYPMNIQLAYAYVYLASGWNNEYLARVLSTLLSLGCLSATYTLARLSGKEAAGMVSILLLALTPTFGRWASTGYVDLPTAFYFTLAAVFAWRLWETHHPVDALLAGGLTGLAAWTKNAALIGVPVLVIWLSWAWVNRRVGGRLALMSLAACVLIAAPWYVRNWFGAGFLIPDTVWTDDARPSLDNLFILALRPEIYGLSGWLMLVGWSAVLVNAVRQRNPGAVTLALWTLPLFATWWWFASYDPRFLLLILPLLAAAGGIWSVRMWEYLPSHWRIPLRLILTVATLILAATVVWNSVEFKDEILRHPLMDDTAKHAVVLSER